MKLGKYRAVFSYRRDSGRLTATICALGLDQNFAVEGIGVAVISPGDNFCKETGRRLSLKRAMMDAGLDKETRTQIWEAYRISTLTPKWGTWYYEFDSKNNVHIFANTPDFKLFKVGYNADIYTKSMAHRQLIRALKERGK